VLRRCVRVPVSSRATKSDEAELSLFIERTVGQNFKQIGAEAVHRKRSFILGLDGPVDR
jgi:hypothetical protein